MKSAYELAMERLGGSPLKDYSDAEKEQLAEVDRLYDAKEAEAQLNAKRRRQEAAHDPAQLEQVGQDLAVELASVEQRRERDKNRLREQFDAAND